jgi:hypothetical protein
MKKFTIFCRSASGQGTTWIGLVIAKTLAGAKRSGLAECAADWKWDKKDIVVIGVAEGNVNILFWDDNV